MKGYKERGLQDRKKKTFKFLLGNFESMSNSLKGNFLQYSGPFQTKFKIFHVETIFQMTLKPRNK